MSETSADLQRKIYSATDLGAVVRTMKALAGSRIGEYQNAVRSLEKYYHTIELGLYAYLKIYHQKSFIEKVKISKSKTNSVIVVGSDQGLIGQFNETLAGFVLKTMKDITGYKKTFVVGERILPALEEAGIEVVKTFRVPNTVPAITPLVTELLLESEASQLYNEVIPLYLFYNRPLEGVTYTPTYKKLLPLDAKWQQQFRTINWPSKNIPEIMGNSNRTLKALVKEYIFVSIFRGCAESMSAENSSRLAAMQRAEKNINALLEEMKQNFHQVRQNKIDEELFDVISGFNAIK